VNDPPLRNPASPSRTRSTGALIFWTTVAVILIVLGFAGTASGESDTDVLYDYAFAGGSVVIYGILVGITFAIAGRLGSPLEAAGLKRFQWRWVWIAIGLIILILILAQALEPLLHAGEEQGLEPKEWRPDRARAFAINSIVAATVVPFAEELFFRGVGVRAWLPFGGVTAILVTALTFGLGHGILVALPVLVPFGLALGWVRWRSDSVWPGMLAHGFYNGSALLVLYFQLTN
jgi:membrane protease YdiL (CAAX protease family)